MKGTIAFTPDEYKYEFTEYASKEQAENDFICNILETGKPEYIVSGFSSRHLFLCDVGNCDNDVTEFWKYKNDYFTLCKYHAKEMRRRKHFLNFTKVICYD